MTGRLLSGFVVPDQPSRIILFALLFERNHPTQTMLLAEPGIMVLERRAKRWQSGLAVTAVRTGQMALRLAALLPRSTSTNNHQPSRTLPALGWRRETTYFWQPAPSVPRGLTHRSVEHGRHSIFNGDGLSRRVHLRNVSSILHQEMGIAASEVILSGRKERLIDCHLRLLKTLRHPTDPVRFV